MLLPGSGFFVTDEGLSGSGGEEWVNRKCVLVG